MQGLLQPSHTRTTGHMSSFVMAGCRSHCFSGERRGNGTGDVPPSNLHSHRRTRKEGEEQDEAADWAGGTQVELLGL